MPARFSRPTITNLLVVSGIAVVGLLAPSRANAQDAAAPGERPPLDLPASAQSASEHPRVDGGRVRAGFDFDFGVGADDGSVGPLLGLKGRLGWQFSHRVGAYLQGGVFNWQGSEKTSASGSSAQGAMAFQATPLFSLTPRDSLEFALGPSLDYVVTGASSAPASEGGASGKRLVVYDRSYPAAHARFALHMDSRQKVETSRRFSLTVGADAHTTFAEGIVLAFVTAGFGLDWY